MKKLILITLLLIVSHLSNAQTIDTVYSKVRKLTDTDFEIAPRFKNQSLYSYLNNNIKYPAGLKTNIEGWLTADIFVDTTGNIVKVTILKHLSPTIDQEVINVIGAISGLKPAIYQGQVVPLNFVLNISIRTIADSGKIKIDAGRYWPITNTYRDPEKKVFTAVEKEPSYPGGYSALGQYLGQNIKYPPNAFKQHIQGKVFIQFVIETDGSLTRLEAISSPDDELSIEALRVMRSCPKFIPGIQNGKPVSTQFVLPINFSL